MEFQQKLKSLSLNSKVTFTHYKTKKAPKGAFFLEHIIIC